MAKDPAMLWYWNDWFSGTVLMSRFLKGCYMDLLHAQFNNGRLSLEEIKTVLGSDFGQAWPSLSKKFKEADGLFFNERLEQEKEKRMKFTESRRQSRLGSKNHTNNVRSTYDTTHEKRMENENKNEDENKVVFSIEKCKEIALADPRWVKANNAVWQELDKFNEYLERQGTYQINPLDYKKYFSKLKGKYPDLVKMKLTIEDYRRMAREQDELERKLKTV